MAKFSRFTGGKNPFEAYEGDYMVQNRDFVKIFKQPRPVRTDKDEQVAAIHLTPGQSVKKAD